MAERRANPHIGALYGALDRLLAEGPIEVEREEVVDSRARRAFALSTAGREVGRRGGSGCLRRRARLASAEYRRCGGSGVIDPALFRGSGCRRSHNCRGGRPHSVTEGVTGPTRLTVSRASVGELVAGAVGTRVEMPEYGPAPQRPPSADIPLGARAAHDEVVTSWSRRVHGMARQRSSQRGGLQRVDPHRSGPTWIPAVDERGRRIARAYRD
ncbi:PadR family transcriptional regulator [Streptomyces sp. ODS05-4]|uniref:PadR family transcriptional regulator n=1 Tax=Streptomyces sp. ODS05-4 TaxID=2944939 RepID=UPI00272ED876|nr:PadR family transcriptional regulator [Streptomyces sp. ODS05-4]